MGHGGSPYSEMKSVLYKFPVLILIIMGCLFLSGCFNQYISDTYRPIYTEKGASVEEALSQQSKEISFVLLNFQDKRQEGSLSSEEQRLVFPPGVFLTEKTLIEFLEDALFLDLKSMGFNISKEENRKPRKKDFSKMVKNFNNKDIVIFIEVYKAKLDSQVVAFGYPYQSISDFDYRIRLWDSKKSRITFTKHLQKRYLGEEYMPLTPVDWSENFLNIDLPKFNAEIAEIILNSLESTSNVVP